MMLPEQLWVHVPGVPQLSVQPPPLQVCLQVAPAAQVRTQPPAEQVWAQEPFAGQASVPQLPGVEQV